MHEATLATNGLNWLEVFLLRWLCFPAM